MSKLLTNQISNYNDNGPVEVKDGVNIPTGKPLQVAGINGTSGQYLTSTGSSIAWSTFPSIPAAQVQTDWNASGTIAEILNKPTLATVATSGSYTDLLNTPTIPSAQIQSDWNQATTSALDFIKNKPNLSNYLTSVALNDLTDVNTAGAANNKIIKYNGTTWVVADDVSNIDTNTTYSLSLIHI